MKKMKIDIWSDVRCPFCYIGKHKFENALKQFSENENVEIVWHSFELDPSIQTDTSISSLEYFVQAKGIGKDQAQQMMQYPKQMGESLGLTFNFDQSVVANSFNAHRLIQMAKSYHLGSEAEEALFVAHFADGVNIDDKVELCKLGVQIGLDKIEVEAMLNSEKFAQEVRQDIMRAQQLGVRGVPYFVFNDKYAVSGTQAEETFLGALNKSFSEFKEDDHGLEVLNNGNTCDMEGNCE